jgi:hypothetical protein
LLQIIEQTFISSVRTKEENMSKTHASDGRKARQIRQRGGEEALRQSPMMAHLLDAVRDDQDIGHYGRLTLAIVARHFLDEGNLVKLLAGQPGVTEEEAATLVAQVQGRDYNPPRRDTILEWQAKQEFPICPDPDNPDACNVYRDLTFPEDVYADIGEFWEEKSEAGTAGQA